MDPDTALPNTRQSICSRNARLGQFHELNLVQRNQSLSSVRCNGSPPIGMMPSDVKLHAQHDRPYPEHSARNNQRRALVQGTSTAVAVGGVCWPCVMSSTGVAGVQAGM